MGDFQMHVLQLDSRDVYCLDRIPVAPNILEADTCIALVAIQAQTI